MWELWMHLDYDHLYIPLTIKKPSFLLWKEPTVVWVVFSSLRSRYHKQANRKNLILPQKRYFKTLKDMIIGTTST